MSELKYVNGDLFKLLPADRPTVIPHVCNDLGIWASGFVVPLAYAFPETRLKYLDWFAKATADMPFRVGETQVLRVSDDPSTVYVANMVAQTGLIGPRNPKPLKYDALAKCMDCVATVARSTDSEIHAPKFGSLRGGGDWAEIEKMIRRQWVDKGLDVTVYVLQSPL